MFTLSPNLSNYFDIESKLISLGHLAGQLGGFVGQSESVKKAVKNAIIAVFDTNQDLKNDLKDVYSSLVTTLSESVKSAGQAGDTAVISELKSQVTSQITEINMQLNKPNNLNYNSPSSPSSSAELAKLQSKLEALRKVKELCGFLTNLNNQQNDPKNLLENLCTGLETFLGFNAQSKGYDGQGIVYSDLDRLCDGVMGFLSGVLGAVKNTQTYNVGKNTLNSVSNEINKHLCSGHDGFTKLLPRLTKGIEKYNTEVRESNEKVSDPIKELLKFTHNDGKLVKDINRIQAEKTSEYERVEKAEALVRECMKSSAKFFASLKEADENIKQLNTDCQYNVYTAKNNVLYETQRLKDFSEKNKGQGKRVKGKEKEKLDELLKAVENMLQKLGSDIKGRIENDVRILVNKLKDAVSLIIKKLQEISQLIAKYYSALEKWTEFAKGDLEASQRNFNIILNEINEGSGSHQYITQAKSAALQIERDAVQLYDAADHTKREVERLVEEVKQKIQNLNEALRIDLGVVKQNIHTGIWTYVSKYVTAVQNKIKETITDQEGLSKIETATKAWAQTFSGTRNFGEKVRTWIKEILKEDEMVKEKLNIYVGKVQLAPQYKTQSAYGINDGITEMIANQVIMKLKENDDIIDTAGGDVDSHIKGDDGSTKNIEKYVTAVYLGCQQFAGGIESIIHGKGQTVDDPMSRGINIFAGEIAEIIEQQLQVSHSGINRSYLTEAVKRILAALTMAANQTAADLEWLIGESDEEGNIGKIDNSLDVLGKLNAGLTTALLTQYTGGGDYVSTKPFDTKSRTLIDLNANIEKTIDKELKEKIGETGNDSKILDLKKLAIYSDESDRYPGSKKKLNDAVTAVTTDGLSSLASTIGNSGPIKRNTFDEQLQHAVGHLDNLCTTIKRAGRDVNFFLDSLGKGKIDDDLAKIKKSVDTLHSGPVAEALKMARGFADHADKLRISTITSLHQQVDEEVKQSTATFTAYARKQYVCSIMSFLEQFAEKVNDELKTLPQQIDTDLTLGYKGFVKKMETHLLPGLTIPPNTPLKDAASTLKAKLTAFMEQLQNQADFKKSFETVKPSHTALLELLQQLHDSKHFGHLVPPRVNALLDRLGELSPKKYKEEAQPMLDTLKVGYGAFAEELDKAYVSVYDGASNINWEQENNPETTYCAKILLTLLQTLFDGLHELRQHCAIKAAWEHKTISLTEAAQHGNTITNPLGSFFKRCGYTVCSGPNKHNGELRNTAECRGGHIHKKLDGDIRGIDGQTYKLVTEYDEKKDEESKQQHGLLKKLFDHLHDYYSVRHLSTFSAKTYPTSVYDMLQWLCGLTYNPVHETLSHDGFSALFEKPEDGEAKHHLIDDMPVELEDADSLEAYPQKITAASLSDALAVVCHYSHDVLTTILGHGHGDGVYACEFNTNNRALMYPSNMDTLLCMICDVVNRLYRQLHFLYNQCQYNTELSGWLDCEYGQGVGGSGWRCNVDQCANQACNQNSGQRANQNGNQRADQRCDQHPKCGVKSPLQSFLEDGLQGFLPHQLKYEKGKVVCSVKDHSGIECITPFGFSSISHRASHRATGQRIVDVLAGYCGNQMSPLTRLCSLFNCVIPTPPKTLGQMFGFYYSLLVDWDDSSKRNAKREAHREAAFNKAVSDADFANPKTTLDMTSLFRSGKHNPSTGDQSSTHLTGDLYALVKCNGNPASDPSHPCGAYLRPLCYDTCAMFSKEHADKYLSWIVYLTETFYTALQKLLEDCQKTCGADSKKCKIGKCKKDCETKAKPLAPSSKHSDACKSIVECGYIRPTFFRYGFIHNNVSSLSGVSGDAHKRTCTDFCTLLQLVTKEGNVLYNIVNNTIPNFFWTIRQKFFWTILALWLLSLLYLLHIMVIRLDLLHIKSHLHSPSSHRIAAQSLLAAGRVNKLNRVFYLQP
ncbi:hypothetical protein, conserved [Babesia bigemina]|uniref:C3H1-type domain-containing protein n=1 Tax=Babesia bigemina TaxID=5866 RepID=A0A061BTY3_BABBI|nr:hypothetical protein, conserved [Babesia bigemina]CDR71929.1 hypothetical protein, conserved [Babesia bigemina]|eukprot:XP_012770871.1 hypothetical protein, conserved [Babesia bigemina]